VEGEMLKGHLDMIVLAALAAGPAHGYAVIEEIRSSVCPPRVLRLRAGALDLQQLADGAVAGAPAAAHRRARGDASHAAPGMSISSSGSHLTRRWRGMDSKIQFRDASPPISVGGR
jgi:hypothetical protein